MNRRGTGVQPVNHAQDARATIAGDGAVWILTTAVVWHKNVFLVPQDPNDEPASALLERIRKRENKKMDNKSEAAQVNTGAKGAAVKEDLSRDVVQYLSKEIETTSNNAMVFRSRIAFAVFFGPFLILSSFVVATKGLPTSLNLDLWFWLVLVIGCGCFVTLAYICSRVEKEAWRQCNQWRELIARLHDDPSSEINDENQWEERGLKVIYIAAYCLLLVTFLSAIIIISRVRVVVSTTPADIPTSAKPNLPPPQQER